MTGDSTIASVLRDGWQPIETAPRDGREVLLWGYCFDRKYSARYANDINVGWFAADGEWRTRNIGEGMQPTHWMPLPDAPVQS